MSQGVTLVVHHFVEDFDSWKPVFDEHEAVRRAPRRRPSTGSTRTPGTPTGS